MPKFLELAAPVHPFLTTTKSVSEQEIFDTHNELNDRLPWQFTHDHIHSHNRNFQPESTPVSDDVWSLYHHHHHHPESLNDEDLLSFPPTLSPAASFLSSFLSSPNPTSPLPGASGQSIAGYVLGQTIARGGFSTIKEGKSPSGDIVAIKIVRRNAFDNLPPAQRRRQKSRFTHEARVWASLSHENILPLFHCHHTPTVTYLITLYCPAGSLFDILKREGTPALEQTDAGCMFRQVAKGLRYMHESMSLVHCDVKLENVLVDESGVCRLTDFGLTKRFGDDPCIHSSSEEEQEDIEEQEEVETGEHDHSVEISVNSHYPASSIYKKQRSRSRGRAGSTTLPIHLSLRRHHGPQQQQWRNGAGRPRHATETLVVPKLPDYSFPPGSLQYAAPELLLPRPSIQDHSFGGGGGGGRYTAHPAQDMWALGVLLYALLTGRLPFRDSFEPRLQMKIVKGTFDIPPDIGTHAEAVLKGCLLKEVSQRWNISMVEDAAWGIGYGAVDIAPSVSVVREEQQPPQAQAPTTQMEELSNSLLLCSVGSLSPSSPLSSILPLSSPTSSSRSRERRFSLFTTEARSRSRSPSSSPQTPVDEDGLDFLEQKRGSRRGQSAESGVRFVLSGNKTPTTRGRSDKMKHADTQLDYAATVIDEEDCCAVDEPNGSGLSESEVRARRERAKSRSQSRNRSWSFNI